MKTKSLSYFLSSTQIVNASNFDLLLLTQQHDVILGFDFLPNQNVAFSEQSRALKILNCQST